MLTSAQIEFWRRLWQEASADAAWVARNRELDARRMQIRDEILDLLNRYLADELGTSELRANFDRRTRTDWEGFGFKGPGGAMFLNKLVKYLGGGTSLVSALRSVLPLPKDEEEGRTRMRSFLDYLNGEIKASRAEKNQLQPARVSFFISCWWHLQDTERWPIFYVSGKKALAQQGVFTPSQDPVQDYFAFRQCFLSLASALKVKSWDLEHLFWWDDARRPPDPPKGGGTIAGEPKGAEKDPPESAISHTQVQWQLAKIGQKLGCRIWVPANDQGKEWNGQRLGDFCVKDLPALGMDSISQAIIRLIDVLWLKGTNQVVAAFEIERTTSIYSGLLRMSDLITSSPHLNIPLYIVAPEARLPQVRKQLSRPTFQYLKLHQRCWFFSNELLVKEAENVLRWATDASVMKEVASQVPDVTGEGMTVE